MQDDPELPADARSRLKELGDGAAPRCSEAMVRGRTLRLRRRLAQASALGVAASAIAVGAVTATTVRGGEPSETVVAESVPPTAGGIFQAPLLLTAEPTPVTFAPATPSSHATSAPSSLGASGLLDASSFGPDWAAKPTTRSRPEWSLGDDYCSIGTGQRARRVVTGSFADAQGSSEAVQELSLFDSAADAQELITLWRSSEGCEGAYTTRPVAIPNGFVAEYDPFADGPIPSSLIVQRHGALISVVRLTTVGGNSDEALQKIVDAVEQRF